MKTSWVLSLACAMLASGCSNYQAQETGDAGRIEALEAELTESKSELAALRASKKDQPVQAANPLLPSYAKPGECYARVWVEPTYKTLSKQVLVQPESTHITTTDAQYKWVEEQVLEAEASTKLVSKPAQYRFATETIEVKPETRQWMTSLTSQVPVSEQILAAASNGGIDLKGAPVNSCYHEHVIPPKVQKSTRRVEVSPASYTFETTEAQYRWVEKQVLVKEASKKLVQVPAKFETYTEQVIDKPAHTTWKKGEGPIQKINEATGEIMCLVEVPATYKTVTRQRLITPATTREVDVPAEYETVRVKELVQAAERNRVEIPAKYENVEVSAVVGEPEYVWHEVHDASMSKDSRTGNQICLVASPAQYKTVKRKVLVSEASTEVVDVPAAYETRKVRKLISPAKENTTIIPAKYQTVQYQELLEDGKMEWRNILCKTNMTPGLISQLQSTLNAKGYDAGSADGIIGKQTIKAVNAYQADNNLPQDKYLNMETLEHMKLL